MKNIYLTLITSFLIIPTYLNAQAPPGGGSGSGGTTTVDNTIPEPSIIALLGVGVAAVFLIKKFKK